jgi:hypothetical protein
VKTLCLWAVPLSGKSPPAVVSNKRNKQIVWRKITRALGGALGVVVHCVALIAPDRGTFDHVAFSRCLEDRQGVRERDTDTSRLKVSFGMFRWSLSSALAFPCAWANRRVGVIVEGYKCCALLQQSLQPSSRAYGCSRSNDRIHRRRLAVLVLVANGSTQYVTQGRHGFVGSW